MALVYGNSKHGRLHEGSQFGENKQIARCSISLRQRKKKRKEVIPDSGIAVGSGSRHVPNRRSIQDPEEGPRARRDEMS